VESQTISGNHFGWLLWVYMPGFLVKNSLIQGRNNIGWVPGFTQHSPNALITACQKEIFTSILLQGIKL